jgi:hypothetical protein
MSQTNIGVLLVVICTLLEGIGQVFLKKSVLRAVRWYLWISFRHCDSGARSRALH